MPTNGPVSTRHWHLRGRSGLRGSSWQGGGHAIRPGPSLGPLACHGAKGLTPPPVGKGGHRWIGHSPHGGRPLPNHPADRRLIQSAGRGGGAAPLGARALHHRLGFGAHRAPRPQHGSAEGHQGVEPGRPSGHGVDQRLFPPPCEGRGRVQVPSSGLKQVETWRQRFGCIARSIGPPP